MHPLFMVAISVVLGVGGQLSFKYAMMRVGSVDFSHLSAFVPAVVSSPFVWLGLCCYGLSTVMWLVILSRVNLSFAYPLLSTGYILVVVLSYYIFKEPVGWLRFGGVLVIVAGVIMVTHS
jgi:multidrug transporter EmrE-like cation transporter